MRLPLSAVLAVILLAGSAVRAEEPVATSTAAANAPSPKPLWEAGVFGGAAMLPHYRGSNEYTWYFVPLPFLIYRGEVIQTDREGLRGIFFKSDRVETEFSFSGSPPADRNDQARQGMPRLDAIGEAGPALKLFLHRGPRDLSLYSEPAVRGAVAGNTEHWSTHYVGIRGALSLILADYKPLPNDRWSLGLTAGADFTDARYNRYFYDVDAQHVIPGRPEFRSRGGYAGTSLAAYSLVQVLPPPRLSWGVYGRWENLAGAVYRASPLVRARNDAVFATALSWTIQRSQKLVRGRR